MSEKISVDSRNALLTRRQLLAVAGIGLVGLYLDRAPSALAFSMQAAAEQSGETRKYPLHRDIVATIFWVGEGATAANFHIANTSTEWEDHAAVRFGGVDNPDKRLKNGLPVGFKPKENPFYVGLPASEYTPKGPIPGAREASYWASAAHELPSDDSQSLFKGRWVEVTGHNHKKVYGQWLDTGPTDNADVAKDYPYVFGDSSVRPKNHAGLGAGIDLSPTMAYQLGFTNQGAGSAQVNWRFVEPKNVPKGMWTEFPAIDNKTHWA